MASSDILTIYNLYESASQSVLSPEDAGTTAYDSSQRRPVTSGRDANRPRYRAPPMPMPRGSSLANPMNSSNTFVLSNVPRKAVPAQKPPPTVPPPPVPTVKPVQKEQDLEQVPQVPPKTPPKTPPKQTTQPQTPDSKRTQRTPTYSAFPPASTTPTRPATATATPVRPSAERRPSPEVMRYDYIDFVRSNYPRQQGMGKRRTTQGSDAAPQNLPELAGGLTRPSPPFSHSPTNSTTSSASAASAGGLTTATTASTAATAVSPTNNPWALPSPMYPCGSAQSAFSDFSDDDDDDLSTMSGRGRLPIFLARLRVGSKETRQKLRARIVGAMKRNESN